MQICYNQDMNDLELYGIDNIIARFLQHCVKNGLEDKNGHRMESASIELRTLLKPGLMTYEDRKEWKPEDVYKVKGQLHIANLVDRTSRFKKFGDTKTQAKHLREFFITGNQSVVDQLDELIKHENPKGFEDFMSGRLIIDAMRGRDDSKGFNGIRTSLCTDFGLDGTFGSGSRESIVFFETSIEKLDPAEVEQMIFQTFTKILEKIKPGIEDGRPQSKLKIPTTKALADKSSVL